MINDDKMESWKMIGVTVLLALLVVLLFFRHQLLSKPKEPQVVFVEKTLPATWKLFWDVGIVQCKHWWRRVSGSHKLILRLPSTHFHLNDIIIDKEHLHAYNTLCGYGNENDFVPITYPLILLFKVQSQLLLLPDFPFPGLGLVHISNHIEQWKKITPNFSTFHSSPLHLFHATVYCEDSIKRHKKGYCFTIVSDLYCTSKESSESKELVWRSKSTVLFITNQNVPPVENSDIHIAPYESLLSEEAINSCAGEMSWTHPENLGRKFAALSHDYNPIHINRLSAALFGFTRGHITHGMCTCARALSNIQSEDNEVKFYVNNSKTGSNQSKSTRTVTFYIEFKTPVFLPSEVLLQTAASSDVEHRNSSSGKALEKISSDTCFFRVMSSKKRDLPHVKGFISCKTVKNI